MQKALTLDASHVSTVDAAGSADWDMRDFAKVATQRKCWLEQISTSGLRRIALSPATERAS